MPGDPRVSFIIRAIDRATAPLRRVTNNFERMTAAQTRADRAFSRAANLRQAGEGVARFARVARTAALAPTAAFEDFQEAIAQLRGVSGLTGMELQRLSDEAIRLGTSIGEFDPSGAARGMTELSRAGYTSEEILQTLPSLLDLSTTSTLELSQATKIVTGIMGGFGLSADQANRAVDVLTATANNSKTTVETLGQTFEYLAPVARAAGLSLEQSAVLAGALGNASIEASRAGTSLNAVLLRFAGARRGPGSEMLKELGVELDTVVDGAKRARDPLLVFADLGKRISGLDERRQLGILGRIFGSEAAPGAAILSRAMGDVRTETLQSAVSVADMTNVTARMATDFRATGKNETKQLTSALSTLGIVVGRQLEPAISRLKMAALSVVEAITKWAKKHPRLTRAIGLTVGALAVLSTVLVGIIFTLAAASSAIGVFNSAMGGTGTGAQLLGAALRPLSGLLLRAIPGVLAFAGAWWSAAAGVVAATWPILAVVAVIAAVVGAVYLVVQHWDRLTAAWGRFRSASLQTKIVLGLVLAPLVALASPIIAIAKLVRDGGKIFHGVWTEFRSDVQFVLDVVMSVVNWLSRLQVPDWLAQFGQAHLDAARAVGQTLTTTASTVGREAAYVATGNEEFLSTGGGTQTNVGGKILVEVQSDQPTSVRSVSQEGPVELGVDVGYTMGLP